MRQAQKYLRPALTMGTMLLDTGRSPFRQVMDVLRERNYAGTIVIENNYGGLPLCAQAENRFSLAERDMPTVHAAISK